MDPMLFGLPFSYLIEFAVTIVVGCAAFVGLLHLRRRWKKHRPRRTIWADLLLSFWMLCAFLTGVEFYFAFIYDQSDSFNMTLASKRWFNRHVEPFRNSDGFRDSHELPQQLPAGTRHIVFVGDSFTLGHGVPRMEDRFTDLLAADLQRQRPGAFIVSNLGEAGYEVSLIEGLVRALVDRGRPVTTLVYVYNLNDIEGYDPRTAETIKALQQNEPRFWLFTKCYSWNWFYFRYRQFSRAEVSDYFPHLRKSYETEAWNGLTAKIASMHDCCRSAGVDFRMVIFPFVHNLEPDYPFASVHEKMVQYCRESGIPVLDLLPVLNEHAGERLVVSRFDAHPNEAAHAIVARALRQDLLADLFEAPDKP
jgi:hypothetical protein